MLLCSSQLANSLAALGELITEKAGVIHYRSSPYANRSCCMVLLPTSFTGIILAREFLQQR